MRFLHTADWHVGKTLYGRSRLDEQERVIAEIVEIARRERVDCVLLAGDVFETMAPTGDTERLVCDALAEFAGAGIAIVVVGGNHDHPRRLGALRKLGNPLSIFVRPDPARASEGGVIPLQRRDEMALIAVLPWVPEYKIVDICQMMQPEYTWYEAYSDNVAAMSRQLAESFTEATVNILAAHLFAFGAETSGSERAVHVAAPFGINPGQLPKEAQYIALGHLHKPQEVGSASRCFYSGSPLELDFGERGQQKRVVIVDANAGLPAHIESINLTSGRKLREITTTMEKLPTVDVGREDYLRVIVQAETRISGLSQQVSEVLPNVLEVRQEVRGTLVRSPRPDPGTVTPVDLFARYVKKQKGVVASAEMLARFEELYREAKYAAD
jgi:exonuclease SbcD